jgi:hypothetical protein
MRLVSDRSHDCTAELGSYATSAPRGNDDQTLTRLATTVLMPAVRVRAGRPQTLAKNVDQQSSMRDLPMRELASFSAVATEPIARSWGTNV